MAFDYEAARAEGYSDAEIADHLAKQYKFDIGGARNAGYNDEEILGHLAPKAGFVIPKAPEPEQTTPGRLSPKYGGQTTDKQTEYKQGATTNPFHGAIARAANLLGEGVEGVARLAEAGGDWIESRIPLSGLTEEQIKNERQLEPLFQFAQSAKNWSKSIGYSPSTQLSELTDNPLNAVPFIAERVISSSPDMVAAVATAPAYWLSRTNEILNDRLKNDNKTIDNVTMGDVSAAAGAAALEVTLEKFATKHLLGGAPIKGKTALGRTAKEVGFQSLTEGAEEGIGYLGGTVGTAKGVNPDELAQNVIEGAIVGGGLGGAIKGSQEGAKKYAEYREKKRQSLLAEGVDPDIADQAVNQMDVQREALNGAMEEIKSGEGLKPNGEPDLDYLEQKYGRQEAPPPAVIAEPAPVAEAPAAPAVQPVAEVPMLPAAELPPVPLPDQEPVTSKEIVLQNRDRSSPASVTQMQNIAAQPDYLRLGVSNVANTGAPIVFGNVKFPDQFLGNETTVTDERGNRYPMQYAVVEANQVMPSNNADGTPNADYSTFQGLRAIGGNGRMAGLQSSYQNGKADAYRSELQSDMAHGIAPEAISQFENPVLVRLMDPDMVKKDTADNFNVSGAMDLSLVERAANDARRVDLTKLDTDDNGNITVRALKEFISAMPQSELSTLMDKNGMPTNQAIERLEAAVFQQAYQNPGLVAIAYESADNEARNIIKSMTAVAPQMMRLAGTDYDIREDLVAAVEKAISAKRSGLSLHDAARQIGINESPLVNDFVQLFADNARSAKATTNYLNGLANMAYEEAAAPDVGLFGETQRRTLKEIKEALAPKKEADLFAEKAEKPAEKKAEEKKPEEAKKEEAPKAKVDHSMNAMNYMNQILQNAQEGYEVAMSEEASGRRGGGKKTMSRVRKYLMEKLTPILGKKDAKRYADYLIEEGGVEQGDMGTNHELYEMAVQKIVQRMEMAIKGAETMAKMKESHAKTVGKSLWKNTEYADRIEKFLSDLRRAGDEQYADMLDNALSQDASKGALKESDIAFREESARKRVVELTQKEGAKPVEFNPMTVDKLSRIEQGIGKLPIEIQESLADTWNELAPKIYSKGYRYSDVNSSSPTEVRNVKDKIAEAFGSVLRIAGQRYMRDKGYKSYNADKHAQFERQASDLLGIDTTKYPGVDSSERILSDGKVRNGKAELIGQERVDVIEEPIKEKKGIGSNKEQIKRADNYYNALLAEGFERLPEGDPRNYTNAAGEEYSTLYRNGVSIGMTSGNLLFMDRGRVNNGWATNDEWTIDGLIVDPSQRQSGLATSAMEDLTKLADKYNISLYMEPVAIKDKPMSTDQLVEFYKRFGFNQKEAGSDKILYREPGQNPKTKTTASSEGSFEGATDEAVAEVAEDFAGAMASQEEGGWQETHVFDPPAKDEIVRLDEKVRVYHRDHGWMTPAQAKKQIAEWQKNVDKQGSTSVNSDKVVLSLFDLSGEWSKPWAEAGYQVYQFDIQDESTYTDPETGEEKMFGDVNNFSVEFFNDMFGSFDGNDVYAILAACPCTDFASSGARHFAAKDASGQTVDSVELVHQTLRTIEYFRPQVWAIENPVGRIEKLTGLPPWRLSFNPNQFGDPYTKRTLLWGRFNADLPVAPVEPTEGSKMHKLYGGKSQATKNARSVTPEGFAYAFFQANNAVDHPVMAIANKFDRLDRELFQQAVDAGMTFDEMNTVVEEAYYDQDDEQATQNLIDAIAEKIGEDSSNWSIVLGQSVSNAANDAVRKQQISELQSVKQQMSAIERRLAKAELKPMDEAIYKVLYESSRRLRDDIKYTYQPNKSPAKVLADAAKALANGDIEQEVFDVIDYLYKKNPNVLDGLRLSIRKQKAGTEQMAKGQFNGLARIVRLFKETDGVKDPSTIRHELAHSLEQMMTAEARERVNNVWRDKLLRASKAEKTEAGKKYFENVAKYLVAPSEKTWTDAVSSMPNISYYQYISPSEFWAANAEPLMKARMGGAWEKFKTAVRGMYEGLKNIFGISNKYAVHSVFKQVMDGERLGTEQLDDYFIRTGFKPLFSASKHKNVFGNEPAEASWIPPIIGQYSFNGFMKKYKEYLVNQTPIGKWIDHIVYKLGDKFVDLKRVQKAIGKNLGEAFDAYMRETLYHGRVSAKLEEYMQYEVMPLLDKMVKYGIDKAQLNKFLHARHAEEYNQHINNINPNAAPGMPMHNRGSGMSTEDAQAFMDSLTPEEHRHLTELADKIDDMVRKTQDELVEGQIEKPETIQMWRESFPFYVPLYRTELDYANTSAGIGRGFSTQSGFGKSATGSLKDVDDILSNITAQRERAVVRSEKGRVARAVYAMAVQNPNAKFWLPVNPRAGALGKLNKAYAEYQGKLDDLETIQKIIETNQVNGVPESEYKDLIQKERNLRSSVTRSLNAYKKMQFEAKDAMVALRKELSDLGLSQQDIVNYIQEPEVPYIDPTSGKVKYKPNTIARNSASVLSVPVDGETRYIFFNPSDASALRMVESLKNLDADKIEGAMKMFNWYTQNIAKLSTQWNLVFGAINFLRDVQGAMLNLTTTPIAGKQKEVFKNIGPALAGIYAEQRLARESKRGKSEWSKLWKEFQEEGGQTGFRDQFAKTEEQKSRIDRELKKMQHGTPIQKARAVFEWISDVNETAENAVRLSAYKVAKAKFMAEGMSEANARARAAEVGKNLTVNFNRKGASTKTANALYAFFNASVQGTARMFQTLTGPKGKLIMGGLVAVGIADALAMAAAGFDEDEPPEFVRQRNLIIPVGGGKYAQIPMPLGFNYFVNFGRIITELGIHPGKRGIDAVKNLLTLTTESVNPLGQGNFAYQIAPTFADPLVGLVSNKDAFGRPIYKEDQATNPLPGYLRAKESASGLATWVSKQINFLTGGTEYRQGMFTPTPDQLEYIVGQLTGGVGREIQRGAKYTAGVIEGKPREEVAWHQVPVAGRFFGETTSQSNVSDKFYKNVTELAEYEHEIKGRRKDKKDVQEFLDEHPEAKLWSSANAVENQISQLKKMRKMAKEKGDDARVKKINEQITRVMDQFNRRYKSAIAK